MAVGFEQEILARPKEERSSSNVEAETSKNQMCPVSYTSQGSADSFCDNGTRNRGSLWPGCRKQWPDGGGNSLNSGESAG